LADVLKELLDCWIA